ncbi:8-amino-7-oxononanoate synthase [Candidatus Magnetominusculus dajiuhuensis]|uniref:8-amino-7-oxononanoate synthase n=1 Tax=Candidatus Magnetominusculus dajiuhuensis TaxID=3137712 RepID=UPI003B42A6F9
MDYYDKIEELKRQDLLRSVKDRDCRTGRTITIAGREFLNFSSNDYLGLASNPVIVRAAQNALMDFGHGAGASRLLSGGTSLHAMLEDKTASFKGADKAVMFNSGYAANTGAIPALTDAHCAIFSDALNHASIVDGCKLSAAKKYIYKHNDLNHLETLLRKSQNPPTNTFVITESVFSMDGDVADIYNLHMLCRKYDTVLYIDDAHATGVLGNGKGALAHFNVTPDNNIIQMGTYSKSLGSVGGFVAASEAVIDYLFNTARSLIYSTALPASAAAASLAAIDYVVAHPELISRLRGNITACRRMLLSKEFSVSMDLTPIIPIVLDSTVETLRISGRLLDSGIYVPAIRPPTVKTPRLRISISASHEQADIAHLANALAEARK